MLLVLIAVAAAAIDEESQTVYDDGVIVDARGWRGAAGWIIFVAGVALITEGIMLLLRFVNPKCFNNSYGVFGGLVRKPTDCIHLYTIHTRILRSVYWQGLVYLLVVLSPELR